MQAPCTMPISTVTTAPAMIMLMLILMKKTMMMVMMTHLNDDNNATNNNSNNNSSSSNNNNNNISNQQTANSKQQPVSTTTAAATAMSITNILCGPRSGEGEEGSKLPLQAAWLCVCCGASVPRSGLHRNWLGSVTCEVLGGPWVVRSRV